MKDDIENQINDIIEGEIQNGINDYIEQQGRGFDGKLNVKVDQDEVCLLYTSPSPRDRQKSRMPSSA